MAACKAQARQRDIEQRLALQRLERENAKLRGLLIGMGVDEGYIEEYLRSDGGDAEDRVVKEKIAIPALRKVETSAKTASIRPSMSSYDTADAGYASSRLNNTANTARLKQLGPSSNSLAETVADTKTLSKEATICDCAPNNANADDSWPASESALTTTLCAIAEELIHQYNTRGVDMAVIKQKLCAGFRRGMAAGEGCRVQNHILFEVLDEISGNLS